MTTVQETQSKLLYLYSQYGIGSTFILPTVTQVILELRYSFFPLDNFKETGRNWSSTTKQFPFFAQLCFNTPSRAVQAEVRRDMRREKTVAFNIN